MKARWFGSQPGGEAGDFLVGAECFERVVLLLQLFFREDAMDTTMAGAAEESDAFPALLAGEVSFKAGLVVAGTGEEMVAGEGSGGAAAEFANAGRNGGFRHSCSL